jgi:hypothetical protein
MTVDHTPEPLWINEPDWLCAVEFLNDADPEGRDLAADTIVSIRARPYFSFWVDGDELEA